MKCNGDCFNCLYDDCILTENNIKSLRLADKKKDNEDKKPAANLNGILTNKKGC